jgi:hypothetical protein
MGHGDAGGWLAALEQSALGEAMRGSLWLYPAVETLHILGFAALVGSIAVVDLRLLGLVRRIALTDLLRLALPVAWAALALAVPTGALLFLTEATAYAANAVFPIKMSLIGIAVLNGLLFHTVTARRMAALHGNGPWPWPARVHGAASLLCWAGALICGRLIAYM